MKDVSEAAQVSLFTVSRAMTGGDGISATTRAHVLEVADRLGYIPNQLARGLRGGTTKTVGVLTANTNNHYYATLVNAIERAVQRDGYHCMVMDAVLDGFFSADREGEIVADLLEHQIAAVVLIYPISDENLTLLRSRGVEILFVDTLPPDGFEQCSSVISDNHGGARALGEHLAGHGYRGPWATVAFTATYSSRVGRVGGFEAAARDAGVEVDVIEGSNDARASHAAVLAYLDDKLQQGERLPRAIFCGNELLLQGTLRALADRGLRVPWDVAIVSYDDFDWAPYVEPAITVIDQRIDELGSLAGGRLLHSLESRRNGGGAQTTGDRIVVPAELIVRRSCGCRADEAL